MRASRKAKICDINEHLICKICKGYFIDATTIVECLHTFCRSCIVKYLESNKYCPICEVQVHKTKPLLSIKRDKTIQDIVYKVIPRLYHNELKRRGDFYTSHPENKPSSNEETSESQYNFILNSDEDVDLTLNYLGCKTTPRYLRCPAGVNVGHLHRLIKAKYDLNLAHKVEVMYEQENLASNLTLMDVAYIYKCKRKRSIDLSYRIYECTSKKLKTDSAENQNNNNWQEVQLRISENGEMEMSLMHENLLKMVEKDQKTKKEVLEDTKHPKVKKIEDIKSVDTKVKNKQEEIKPIPTAKAKNNEKTPTKKEIPDLKYIGKEPKAKILQSVTLTPVSSKNSTSTVNTNTISTNLSTITTSTAPLVSLSNATTTTVFSTINTTKCSTKTEESTFSKSNSKSEPPKKDATAAINKEKEEKCQNNGATPTKNDDGHQKTPSDNIPPITNNNVDRKRKTDQITEEPKPKQIILNHTLNLVNLTQTQNKNNNSLTSNSTNTNNSTITSSSSGSLATTTTTSSAQDVFQKPLLVTSKNLVNAPRPGTPAIQKSPNQACYMPKNVQQVLNVPKVTQKINTTNKIGTVTTPTTSNSVKLSTKTKPSTPIGYKTLRDPPKSWNSQISKANVTKTTQEMNNKNLKPAKFFKMRNNLPRFLGNPGLGVKPMYQLNTPENKEKSHQDLPKTTQNEIKRHSIVKIDPKTLKPISEKAPDDTNLSNQKSTVDSKSPMSKDTKLVASTTTNNSSSTSTSTVNNNTGSSLNVLEIKPITTPQQDLKINTSSVSIFNPLKNHSSSPKNDRKSPKSPGMAGSQVKSTTVNNKPKPSPSPSSATLPSSSSPKTQQTATPPPSKPAKPNLSFTPPNPYIPNLNSPTLNPNQFQFYHPQQHSSLPAFDPRILNAYHNLWAYAPRFGFGNPAAAAMANLTMELSQQQRQKAAMLPSQALETTTQQSKMSGIATSTAQITSKLSLKKPIKEGTKSEKSLHTTVEKLLVQNRTKQILNTKENNSEEGTSKVLNNNKEKEKNAVVEKDKNTSSAPVVEEKTKEEPVDVKAKDSDLKVSEKDTKQEKNSDKIVEKGDSKNTV